MKFKGTIIITDPCYVVKDTEIRLKEAGITAKFPLYNDDIKDYEKAVRKYHELVDPYDDWKTCECGSNMEKLGFSCISEPTIYGDWSCTTWSTPRNDLEVQIKELNDLYDRRWGILKKYGKHSDLYNLYDKQCTEATANILSLGNFCADSGMVAVFLLEEVLIYNPDFSKWIEEHPWCVTVIHDFDGDVQYYIDENNDAHIIGRGNINFFTSQTGF